MSGLYNPIIYPPLSALRSEDEDIFGATVLIFPLNYPSFREGLRRRFERFDILKSSTQNCEEKSNLI